MLAVATKGLYFPTSTTTLINTGGAPPPCPDPPTITPVEPKVQAKELKPKSSAREGS